MAMSPDIRTGWRNYRVRGRQKLLWSLGVANVTSFVSTLISAFGQLKEKLDSKGNAVKLPL
jgi:hypothetical protein